MTKGRKEPLAWHDAKPRSSPTICWTNSWPAVIRKLPLAGTAWPTRCRKRSTATLVRYNTERRHQGRSMNGRIPLQAFVEGLPPGETDTKPQPLAP